MDPATGPFRLEPERDAEAIGPDRFVAVHSAGADAADPWLKASNLRTARLAGRLVELTYAGGLWDEPARPIFRFWQGPDAFIDRIAAAPIAGRGIWIGRVPRATTGLSISPTNRFGPFSFRLESIRRRWLPSLLMQGAQRRKKQTRSTILTRLIGWGPESDVNLAWAIGSTPLDAYTAWRTRHERPPDVAAFDLPRFDWGSPAATIHLVVGGKGDHLDRTLASLASQVFGNWRAWVIDVDAGGTDKRIASADLETVRQTLCGAPPDTLVGFVAAGDTVLPLALAQIAEQGLRSPACRVFYGDELQVGDNGLTTPFLKPGWSPRLEMAAPFLGRMTFVRGIADWSVEQQRSFLVTGEFPPPRVPALKAQNVKPLRRLLMQTGRFSPTRMVPSLPLEPQLSTLATIVIPTRDHPALLRRAIDSIRQRAGVGAYRIAVVDNGSVTPDALTLLEELRAAPDTIVIDRPGPFNFSAMCNDAAETSRGDVLVFLNDDTEIISQGALDRLTAHALERDIGAVGAKLTYPDGRLQHVGVLVGMGESSGHFGALAPGDDPGWAGRNCVVHEVSAVTGACLAVAREKFDAVGGFDAEHLPVELSDIDLCLKLNARGWQTIVDPLVHIMHEESASRGGATFRRLDVYSTQREVFVARWRHVLRDDPSFHPGLSLYWYQGALG